MTSIGNNINGFNRDSKVMETIYLLTLPLCHSSNEI